MADAKRYFWLKLREDFFTSTRIKKLRKMAGGDTYLIIYLKMQLKSIKTDGVLTWHGYDDSFADELAIDLDEEPDNVKVCLAYLLACGLAETDDQINYFLPYAVLNVGSETDAAERMRKMRERNSVTPMLQESYAGVTPEKDIEKDIELEIDKEIPPPNNIPPKGVAPQKKAKFVPPSVADVKKYCQEAHINIDEEHFVDFYASKGWKVGKDAMKDWKAAVRNWARRNNKPDSKAKYTKTGVPIEVKPLEGGDDIDRLASMYGEGQK